MGTSLKMKNNFRFICKLFTTFTTGKLFEIRVSQLMTFQCSCCTETLWTFTANIRLHIFMLKCMFLKAITADEFLLTNVAREPSTFIVWLQQMCLELIMPREIIWAVFTWVRLCTSVNTKMKLQLRVCLKYLSTVRTMIWSTVAVCTTFMCLQVAGKSKKSVTQWTLVWLLSRVDSHVSMYVTELLERPVTHRTSKRLVVAVISAVPGKVIWLHKSFATNSTFKRFLSAVNFSVPNKVT